MMASERASPMPGRVRNSSLLAVLMSMTLVAFDVDAPVPVDAGGAVEPLKPSGGAGFTPGTGGGWFVVLDGLVYVDCASTGTVIRAPITAMAHTRLSFIVSLLRSCNAGATLRVARRSIGGSLSALLLCTASAVAERPASLELVLALDGSTSIAGDLFEFQLQGHAAAFRDPKVVEAISSGGGIAVTLVQWSDPSTLQTLVPWSRIADRAAADRFAATIDALPRQPLRGSTGIGGAILNAANLFRAAEHSAQRRVIDIVSNGYNNIGIIPEAARERVVAQGITINGLVILDEVPWLADYFEKHVIGGPAAFVMVADTPQSFGRAILDKLIQEITQLDP